MLESACICALQTVLEPDQTYALISLKVSHRHALPRTKQRLRAEGWVIGCEGRTSMTRAALSDEQGVPLANATATFSILSA
jgi:acyl-coenzyme A thioesterase PaaI-like protein